MTPGDSEPLWIFGYGSLVWRPAFAFAERRAAHLQGWARRFWQGSTDHRGVPGAPGRVVTLVRDPSAECWGVAYRIASDERESILAELDHREKGGYDRLLVDLGLRVGSGLRGLTYLANEENVNYLGPAPLEQIAAQVLSASGPSGPNLEYVRRLADALRRLGAADEHVFALDRLLAGAAAAAGADSNVPGGDQVRPPSKPKS